MRGDDDKGPEAKDPGSGPTKPDTTGPIAGMEAGARRGQDDARSANTQTAAAAPSAQGIKAPPIPDALPTQTKVPSVVIEPVQPPSLSLPKGGGAMQAIGETFKTTRSPARAPMPCRFQRRRSAACPPG